MVIATFVFSQASLASSQTAHKITDVVSKKAESYTFKWTDLDNNKHAFQITLPKSWIQQAIMDEAKYQYLFDNKSLYTQTIQKKILAKVVEYNQKQGMKALSIKFVEGGRKYSIEYMRKQDYKAAEFLLDHYKKESSKLYGVSIENGNMLTINYPQISKKYQPALAAVALKMKRTAELEKGSSLTERELLGYILSFVQTIPYLTESNKFKIPINIFRKNAADCDEKSLVLAGMIKTLFPGKPVALIALDNATPAGEGHMIVLVGGFTYKKGDSMVAYGKQPLMALETTTPWPIGKVDNLVMKRIQEGKYRIIPL